MKRYIASLTGTNKFIADFPTPQEAQSFVDEYNSTTKPYYWAEVEECEFCSEPQGFIGGLATYNSDPFLVDSDELADELFESIKEVELSLVQGEDNFTEAMAKLNLTDKNNVKAIYQGNGVLVCLPQDWTVV